MKYLKPLLVLSLLVITLFTSFKKKDKPEKLLPKEFRELFSHVPGQVLDTVSTYPYSFHRCLRDTSKEISIESFYCSITEVSNLEFNRFINEMRHKLSSSEMNLLLPDSNSWIRELSFGEPLQNVYHWHPAYDEYPVVNISHFAANSYCEWLTDSLNSIQNEFTFEVSLPSHFEWVVAAQGELGFSPYPWGGPFLKNAKGQLLANFQDFGDESIHYNPETKDYEVISGASRSVLDAEITAPINSYSSNTFGLYNMSGNVAEMISEPGIACGGGWRSTGFDIRIHSTMEYKEPQPDIGFRPIIKIVKN